MPTPPEGMEALHTLLQLLQLASQPKKCPGKNRQYRQSWFYLFRGKMCSVCSRTHGPHGAQSISHFYLPHYLLPMGDDTKQSQSEAAAAIVALYSLH